LSTLFSCLKDLVSFNGFVNVRLSKNKL